MFWSCFQVVVPRFAVGIIIGRNGEMIKKIQNDAGVRIQFKQGLGFFFKTFVIEPSANSSSYIYCGKQNKNHSFLKTRTVHVTVPKPTSTEVNFHYIPLRLCFCVWPDDGVSPDRVAQVMGQADNCHHAIHLINELVQTAQVCSQKNYIYIFQFLQFPGLKYVVLPYLIQSCFTQDYCMNLCLCI